jgi:hypothetical protein
MEVDVIEEAGAKESNRIAPLSRLFNYGKLWYKHKGFLVPSYLQNQEAS